MIAYNSTQLDHLHMQQEAYEGFEQKAITWEEYQQVRAAYPVSFYMPNGIIRVGLFLLTCVIVLFAYGLFCLLFMSSNVYGFGALTIFVAIVTYVVLEVLIIRDKKHYGSGIDDALMWLSGSLLFGSICLFSEDFIEGLPLFTTVFVLSGFFALRFADRLMCALAFLSLLGWLFYACLELGAVGKTIAPFTLMAVSFGVYFSVRRMLHITGCRHYVPGLQLVATCSLVTGYLAGNYFMVREVGSTLLGETLRPQDDIPAGWLFWLFTSLIPLLYIFFGIRKKDRILLCTGLLLVAAIVFTIRYYHSVLPLETAMALGGVALIGIAYALTRYLHQPKHGFTSEAPATINNMERLQWESLAIAETFHQTPAPESSAVQFGGGSGGGGGATGEY
jgi:hypothetical protein